MNILQQYVKAVRQKSRSHDRVISVCLVYAVEAYNSRTADQIKGELNSIVRFFSKLATNLTHF